MERLSNATLARLPRAVAGPRYDRAAVRPGIVHLGVGAFQRAHQAVYVDDCLNGDPTWGIVGASLRRPDTRDALSPQDGLYALAVKGETGTTHRVVGSIVDLLVLSDDRERLLEQMADPATRIVSLTVTEKGYCHDPATGELAEDHPDVQADLKAPSAPSSAPGLLVEALRRRRARGIPPFTVLTCDNLPANGPTVRRIVARFAALCDPDLGRFVAGEVAFPATMVDRIVPATTDADRAEVEAALGLIDAWPVVTEPFSQWVVEDRFPLGRPPLETVGVEMVEDVEPYEQMKLRLLNGSHSSLAYLGYLAGYETIAETIADPAFRRFAHGLMTEEAIPTLRLPEADLLAYRDRLLERFANPGLRHRTWQIAMDGSQKLPQRLLGTVRDRVASSAPYSRLALGVAAWMRYAMGEDEKGRPIDVRDPLVKRLRAVADEAGRDPARLTAGYLALGEVFGADLARNEAFKGAVEERLRVLLDRGAAAAVDGF